MYMDHFWFLFDTVPILFALPKTTQLGDIESIDPSTNIGRTYQYLKKKREKFNQETVSKVVAQQASSSLKVSWNRQTVLSET